MYKIGDKVLLDKMTQNGLDCDRWAKVVAIYPTYILCLRKARYGNYYECINRRKGDLGDGRENLQEL